MAINPVPMFVGGGAVHDAGTVRAMIYAALGGGQGVVDPTDFKITATATPGPNVQYLPGGAGILSRYAGATKQAYTADAPSAGTVAVGATTSAGGRSDMVVLRVEDPFAPGSTWPEPQNPATAQYVHVRVIQNVPATARTAADVPALAGQSVIELARIDIPASTATIQNAMITDLRRIADPRPSIEPRTFVAAENVLTATSPTRQNWPNIAHTVDVPATATHMIAKVTIAGYEQNLGMADAYVWMQANNADIGSVFKIDNDQVTDGVKHVTVIAVEVAIPAAWLGKQVTLRTQAANYNARQGRFKTTDSTYVTWEPYFIKRPA